MKKIKSHLVSEVWRIIILIIKHRIENYLESLQELKQASKQANSCVLRMISFLWQNKLEQGILTAPFMWVSSQNNFLLHMITDFGGYHLRTDFYLVPL